MSKSKMPQQSFSRAEVAAAESQIVELSKRIDFYITEYSVEMLANKMRDGEFVVPSYQREFTWEDERKTRFIESLLLGLPIPFLFFWEMPSGKLEIVDGSQRLRTMHDFVHGGFRLGTLEALTACEGFSFEDFSEPRRRKINNRSVRGIVLNEKADEQARFDLFERINTGSKTAGSAEVRRGALAGPFMNMVIDLAKLPAFAAAAPVPKKSEDKREREELVTRFFGYGDGLDGYKDRPREFLFNYVRRMNEEFAANPLLEGHYRTRFDNMLNYVEQVFPLGFRKTPQATSTPRARFEAMSIGSWLAFVASPIPSPVAIAAVDDWLSSKEFSSVTGADGANAKGRLRGRIEFVRARLLGEQ